MVSFSPPKRKPKPTRGRIISVFGAEGSGVSTTIDILREASKATTTVITVTDETTYEELSDAIDEHRAGDLAEIIFLDGFPRSAADIQVMFDNSWAYAGEGAVILVRRGGIAYDPEEIEERIRDYDIPYFTVLNETGRMGLAAAVAQLAQFSQLGA